MSPTYAQAVTVVMEEEVRRLWQARLDWRRRRFADWPPERNDDYQRLRHLVRLLRSARDIARAAERPDRSTLYLQWPHDVLPPVRARSQWAPDPIDMAKAERDRWTEPELREAFGG